MEQVELHMLYTLAIAKKLFIAAKGRVISMFIIIIISRKV